MPLKFPGKWRFDPPADGRYQTRGIPPAMVDEALRLVDRCATQGDRGDALEHFKGYLCRASGVSHVWSTSESWAETDLQHYAGSAAENAPLFIEAFHDACRAFANDDPDVFAPDAPLINDLLQKHGVGFEIVADRLVLREAVAPLVPVAQPSQTLAELASGVLQESLARSEQLLEQRKGREAVQESLWLLETVATGFRGMDTGVTTVEGKYFNQIAKELRAAYRGTALGRILEWIVSLHGYLSSPTGGGVRHGLDLAEGVALSLNEARLYCNLLRSYLSYLMIEHERLVRKTS